MITTVLIVIDWRTYINATLFFDIDGCLLEHTGSLYSIYKNPGKMLYGVAELFEWLVVSGHQIILTTARPECMREMTVNQLQTHGIVYQQLVMGIEHGKRIVINDAKPTMEATAHAFTIPRNGGLRELQVQLMGLLSEKALSEG